MAILLEFYAYSSKDLLLFQRCNTKTAQKFILQPIEANLQSIKFLKKR